MNMIFVLHFFPLFPRIGLAPLVPTQSVGTREVNAKYGKEGNGVNAERARSYAHRVGMCIPDVAIYYHTDTSPQKHADSICY